MTETLARHIALFITAVEAILALSLGVYVISAAYMPSFRVRGNGVPPETVVFLGYFLLMGVGIVVAASHRWVMSLVGLGALAGTMWLFAFVQPWAFPGMYSFWWFGLLPLPMALYYVKVVWDHVAGLDLPSPVPDAREGGGAMGAATGVEGVAGDVVADPDDDGPAATRTAGRTALAGRDVAQVDVA